MTELIQTEPEVNDPPQVNAKLFSPKTRLPAGHAAPGATKVLTGWRRTRVELEVSLHIGRMALFHYRSIRKAIGVLKKLYLLKKEVLGGVSTKIVRVGDKFYHYLYAPGYPSKNFDEYILGEFNRISPLPQKTNVLTFIHLAVTKKCPLRCEHCLEWNNLNKPESLSPADLVATVDHFRKQGIAQFHLSGGEPMVRMKDVLPLLEKSSGQSEFYVLTSGFNFTGENAAALKSAGLTGVVISLDHFDQEKHNLFRGYADSFDNVMQAVQHAHQHGLVIALTICVTRAFVSWSNLMQYAALAKKLNVAYIQVLEPKAVGHYEGKDVFLDNTQFEILDKFFCALNTDNQYRDYPIIIYHGYYQRRMGCMAGGNRTLYIDSEGWVNACPFCQTKNMNIRQVVGLKETNPAELKVSGCQSYRDANAGVL